MGRAMSIGSGERVRRDGRNGRGARARHYWAGTFSEAGWEGARKKEPIFSTPEAAIKRWLAEFFGLEESLIENGCDPVAGLMGNMALVLDLRSVRVVRVIAFRKSQPGESRLPVAVIYDLNSGQVIREESIEQRDGKPRTRRAVASAR